MTIFYLVTYYS